MKKLLHLQFLIALAINAPLFAGTYDFLKKYEPPTQSMNERALFPLYRPEQPLNLPLQAFYLELEKKGELTIYYGMGFERDMGMEAASNLQTMLIELAKMKSIPLGGFKISQDQTELRFINSVSKLKYRLKIGRERDAFQAAFGSYDIVIYVGHSRYGRGPAFGSFWNYFRMGDVFPSIEVDVRNTYFLEEPLQKADTYPPQNINLSGKSYQYQYRGGKDEGNYLPKDAYTKNIPGGPADWEVTEFKEGKQIFFIDSCSNEAYFKGPIRESFPEAQEKLVFGTTVEVGGVLRSVAVFISDLAGHLRSSVDVVSDLNQVEKGFTAY